MKTKETKRKEALTRRLKDRKTLNKYLSTGELTEEETKLIKLKLERCEEDITNLLRNLHMKSENIQ